MTMKLSGDNLIFPDNSVQWSAAYLPFRNRIINGDMRFDQRNNGAAVTLNTAALIYTVDRFGFGWVSGGAVGSAQRISGGISANSLKLTITTGAAPTGNQTYNLQQRIEGFNVSDFLLGTTSAQYIAVSFKVKASITGTFSGALQNGAQNRSYPFTYTINTANVAQPVSFVIPGDQAGTWATDNTAGLIVILDLGGAGTARGAAGSWQAGTFFGVTNAVNLVATTNATFEISEVQVESVGAATASVTPFERVDYSEMLDRCRRYARVIRIAQGPAANANAAQFYIPHEGMRQAPAASQLGLLTLTDSVASYSQSAVNIGVTNNNPDGGTYSLYNYTGLTPYRVYGMYSGAGILLSAEL